MRTLDIREATTARLRRAEGDLRLPAACEVGQGPISTGWERAIFGEA